MLNNVVNITGVVDSLPAVSHKFLDNEYYIFYVNVNRLSNNIDKIPVIINSKKIDINALVPSAKVTVRGEYRSFNFHDTSSTHLSLNIFASDVTIIQNDDFKYTNEIFLNGYLCKPPIFRKTPLNRTVCDVLLAVNRKSKKSDYIPCILWGNDANTCKDLKIGTNMQLNGRIQSRTYQKKTEENAYLEKVAYEVSAFNVKVLEKESQVFE